MVKVLIIDDDNNFRVYLSHILEKEFNAEIKYAGDGKEGFVVTHSFKPDLIIVDDEMPEMRGNELVKKIRDDKKIKDIPIIVMTASNDNNTLTRYIEFNIADYIIKPINAAETLRKIHKVIFENKKTVLVVEDNRAFRMFVEKVLRSKFSKVIVQHANNGYDALKKIEEEKPYLIILDLAMPEMTGKDLLAKIRNNEKNKDIKVVMLTGQNDARAIAEISSLGVSDYILKPVTLEDLYSKLIRYLN